MVNILFILTILISFGCGEARPFKDFSSEKGKSKEEFLVDSKNVKKKKINTAIKSKAESLDSKVRIRVTWDV